MTIRLLGTGGADGVPALFGDDPVSRWAREHGGPDVRSRAAALVDDGLKIDLPPETGHQLERDGLSAKSWNLLIFTHSDEDHLCLAELQYALFPFTSAFELPFTIMANSTVLGLIRDRYPEWPMDLVELAPFQWVSDAGYEICPVRANHTPGEECFNYVVRREGRTLLYATDTGIWPEETFAFLKGLKLDLLVIECTNAFRPASYAGHLDMEGLRYVVDRLRKEEGLAADGRVITTHHAASGGARHCDLETALVPIGAVPGYDGLVIEV